MLGMYTSRKWLGVKCWVRTLVGSCYRSQVLGTYTSRKWLGVKYWVRTLVGSY